MSDPMFPLSEVLYYAFCHNKETIPFGLFKLRRDSVLLVAWMAVLRSFKN